MIFHCFMPLQNTPASPPDLAGLPLPDLGMSWRSLHVFKDSDRGQDFYLTCLKYAQHLWRQRLPARAILCLDRAWGADLTGEEPTLNAWPLPYAPLLEILQRAPHDAFLGNPRIHFQHYADRLGEPRRELRRWRSWACWAIACRALPRLPGDPRHAVREPSIDEIAESLARHGIPGEALLWSSTLSLPCPDETNQCPNSSIT